MIDLSPRNRTSRTALLVVAGILVLAVLFRVLSPVLVSSALVRDRVETAVEAWLGHDVTIDSVPQLEFWPRPMVTLRGIVIRQEDRPGSPVLGHIDELSANFSLLKALTGNPVFQNFTLVGPDITVRTKAGGRLNWSNQGLLGAAVRHAVSTDPAETARPLPEAEIGDVTISGGRLTVETADGRSLVFERINGALDWDDLTAPARLRARAEVRGVLLDIDLSTAQPLQLLGGASASLDLALSSSLMTARFSGRADLARTAFLSGDLQMTVPKIADVVQWANLPVHTADALHDVTLSARLVTLDRVMRFDQLTISANGSSGTGVMDLSMATDTQPPRVTGTLAFDRMDLRALVMAISDDQQEMGPLDPAREPPFERQLGFDARFSVKTASYGTVSLTNAAVSLLSDARRAEVEILDSEMLGGSMSGQISMRLMPKPATKIRLAARNVDFEALAKQLSLPGPLFSAPASIDLNLDLAKPLSLAKAEDVTGSLHLSAASGSIPRLDLDAFRRLASGSGYFSLEKAREGRTDFNSLDLKAEFAAGSARITDATIDGETYVMHLSGVVPYQTRSLSLIARVDSKTGGASHRAFIGGAWPNPVIWPAPDGLRP
ncbi:AsmA-like C-terminal region-containing protein [Rhizobium sp. CSW-27]|uniref:AsmA family protein n=1 Tax=Rhizobium sp. CSW-27 TaxID=2839985 RepID=UPI001C011C52|nr:AsmA-like C-terminal region-containing protein [Rhizobium sp. CSW-27]MBT9371882.1 AsmA family protein [Rhizobium sp. CSW-27]